MPTRVLGVGVGLFIVILLWVTAAILCCISLRTQKYIGVAAIILATIVSLILICIPRESENEAIFETEGLVKIYDTLFVWRVTLVILLGLSSVAAFLSFLFLYLMEPRSAKALAHWNR
ncbi:transmembrane protein 218-like [Bacillus rossius redtenbacheri]|uniref:transmembrane protein 218-like n=1 Tax=Bacillus rossius redtenbacheri TaxID=93214 RepID=UPI002FDD1375